jgi:hypothetical protein
MHVQSEVGEGTTFRLEFPAAAAYSAGRPAGNGSDDAVDHDAGSVVQV